MGERGKIERERWRVGELEIQRERKETIHNKLIVKSIKTPF